MTTFTSFLDRTNIGYSITKLFKKIVIYSKF